MAVAVKKRGEESRIVTKLLEIQSATHQQIIDLGDEIFKKESKKQCKEFEKYLRRHEKLLTEKLEEEKKAALKDLECRHAIEVEKLKQYYIELQNDALKKEAARVKDIMNNVTQTIIEEATLDGQRKLDEAILEARERFDAEKSCAIKETIQKEEEIKLLLLNDERCQHENMIQSLNEEWLHKMKIQEEENLEKLSVRLKEKEEEMEEMFQKRLHLRLVDAELVHKTELGTFNSEIEAVQYTNNNLNSEIETLRRKLEEMKESLIKVLGAFRDFIETSPGFATGQGDFVLDQLVPPKLNEFLNN